MRGGGGVIHALLTPCCCCRYPQPKHPHALTRRRRPALRRIRVYICQFAHRAVLKWCCPCASSSSHLYLTYLMYLTDTATARVLWILAHASIAAPSVQWDLTPYLSRTGRATHTRARYHPSALPKTLSIPLFPLPPIHDFLLEKSLDIRS